MIPFLPTEDLNTTITHKMMKIKYMLPVILLLATGIRSNAQKVPVQKPGFLEYTHSKWVDSIMNTLDLDEKIGQLLMVRAYSNKGEEHKQDILDLIKKHKIGGVVFFQGNPEKQVQLMNEFQHASEIPLLGAIDAEWGLGMRLDSTVSYPFQMALGAIQDNKLIYEMGQEIARQIKRSGLHINFAPVADINNNPDNPVINARSFGEDKKNVTAKAIAYMKGMEDNGLLTTAKHFPGHGDTNVDSHHDLPLLKHSRTRMDTLEIHPFKELIKAGISGVMVAHLNIPALDTSGKPATLSRKIATSLLQDELGFKGLVITDAMGMKGVTRGNAPGIVDRDALMAGNDILELSEDVEKAVSEIRKAVQKGMIRAEDIDAKVRKVLAAKQWAKLSGYQPPESENILQDLNTPHARLLNRKLVEASLTVLKNDNNILPVSGLEKLKIASVSVGASEETVFQKTLALYTKVDHFRLPRDASSAVIEKLTKQLNDYNLIITGIHDQGRLPKNQLGLSEPVLAFLNEINRKNSIITSFKNPYVLDKIKGIERAAGLIVAYQDSKLTEELSAQLIFGAIGAGGKLSVRIGDKFPVGSGLDTRGGIRFKYTLPEEAGMDSEFLYGKVDSLMQEAMDNKAIPGGQVFIAKDGKVVLYKAYGFQDYSDTVAVRKTDLYDLASVTKISSSLPALMQFYDRGKFDVDKTLGDYLPYFRNSDKGDLSFREILAHQAGLTPWIAYWKNTLRKNGSYKWSTIKKDSSSRFPTRISDHMWLHRNYRKKIYKAIKKSPLTGKKEYLYSGLVFYLMPEMVKNMSKTPFLTYLDRELYQKLGATTLTYNPLSKFPEERIVPTEHDYEFRHLPIHGTVHDEGAAMMGGISSNAGLFANANDLAKLMQMYLNMGTYGGDRYIEESTLREFTRAQFPENNNHRGLGFDKPYLESKGADGNTAVDATESSFGHTGFTGTMVWMDPEKGILYVFLSNRVLPTRENTKLYKLNTRTNIQQVIYDALKE